ncbi:hypothetical protein CZ797_09145 [Pseudoalteromonas sp. JB197]|nr:hypothetical protein CZ797_09145 [Pseudoalteromonas sp. JB197]
MITVLSILFEIIYILFLSKNTPHLPHYKITHKLLFLNNIN